MKEWNSNIKEENSKKFLLYISPKDAINSNLKSINDNYSNSNEPTDDSSLHNSKILKINNEENKFNIFRINFYKNNNLNDIPLYQESKKCNFPLKYPIYEDKFGYLYPNDIKTFPLTISGFLLKNNNCIDTGINKPIDNSESKFEESLGIYYCGRYIKFANDKNEKKCSPNEFICKNCMEFIKKKYQIKNNYLINIYGRIAKKNKGKYHCFGHFLHKNQIEDCINKFTCKGCEILNNYCKYFQ